MAEAVWLREAMTVVWPRVPTSYEMMAWVLLPVPVLVVLQVLVPHEETVLLLLGLPVEWSGGLTPADSL